MYQTGTVEKISGGKALVKIRRSSACGESCAACGACPARDQMIAAANTAGADIGNEVIIYLSDSKVLKAAFLVYIIPLAALVFGYALGIKLFSRENMGILSGFAALTVSFVLISVLDRHLKKKFEPTVTGIIK